MSICIEENVLWFEIAVHNIFVVKIIQSECNLSCVEFGDGVRKPLEWGI